MGYHKRFITNKQIVKIFNSGGVKKVIEWYTQGADSVVTESGISSDISDLLENFVCKGPIDPSLYNSITKIIHDSYNSDKNEA